LWGGAALLGGVSLFGFLSNNSETKVNADSVDFKALRSDLAELLPADYEDGSYGPVLVRLAWHASGTYCQFSGTGGSNGGTIRLTPECKHGANAGLEVARDLLEPIKKKYPGISYADLYTFAGAVAIEEMGGPEICWRPGRSDTDDSAACTPDGRLPDAARDEDHIRAIFYRMGFNDREIVALIGAHALGRCHTNRSGFDGPWTKAPTMFTNEFFRELLENTWVQKKWNGPAQYVDKDDEIMMLPTDMALIRDPNFKQYVELYKDDEQVFFNDFSDAFSRLLELGCKNLRPMPKCGHQN